VSILLLGVVEIEKLDLGVPNVAENRLDTAALHYDDDLHFFSSRGIKVRAIRVSDSTL
jgi:hypothetical protein